MGNVTVQYNDFTRDNSTVESISFELLTDVTLTLAQVSSDSDTTEETESTADETESTTTDTTSTNTLTMTMESAGSNLVSGTLDTDALNALIRSLIIFRNQLMNA